MDLKAAPNPAQLQHLQEISAQILHVPKHQMNIPD